MQPRIKLGRSNAGAWTSLSYPKLNKNGLFEKKTRFEAKDKEQQQEGGGYGSITPSIHL